MRRRGPRAHLTPPASVPRRTPPTPIDVREYDRIAEWYTSVRSPEVGVPDLVAWARELPQGARVLDVGCGDGVPLARLLVRRGVDVVGLDSSPEMIARFRDRFPNLPSRCERVQEAQFTAGSFQGVVAWGVPFHLSDAEQEAVIAKVSEWLTPGGRFLFTSAEDEGVREGEMNGVPFRYVSLGASRYRRLLARVGMSLDAHRRDARDNHVYVATKPAPIAGS